MVKYKIELGTPSIEIVGAIIMLIPLVLKFFNILSTDPNFFYIYGAVTILKGFIGSLTIEEVE